MKYNLDFKECLKDSPSFRLSLENAEGDIEQLESKLERVVKLCNTMVETGKAFNNASCGFITGVRDLAFYFQEDEIASTCLTKFCQSMSEMLKFFTILTDQAQRSVGKNLNTFVKTEIKKVKETRKHFEKISDDMDSAMLRNSQAQRSKPQECEDVFNLMMANKSCFAHTSLDYVYQINILQSKKRFEVLETMLSFMRAQATFFHQGHDLYQDSETYMKDIADQVKELNSKAKVEWKEMEERHSLVQKKDIVPSPSIDDENNGVHMEGYLFKKTKHAFKAWVRRWFTIQDNQLRYQKRTKDQQVTVMEDDLRLCTVKPAYEIDRRFCFEVLSPTRTHMLQAHTEEEFQTWVSAIQSGVTRAYRDAEKRHSDAGLNDTAESSSGGRGSASDTSMEMPQSTEPRKTKAQILMENIFSIPGNAKCCDCGHSDPRWTSINLGITLCIECSGIHRGFGVHVSKVRSITLDAWEPELFKVMSELGNDVVNRIYLVNVDDSIPRATPTCTRAVREAWIKAKYIQKQFVSKLPGPKSSESKVKGWRVKKKTRRSPPRNTESLEDQSAKSSPDSDVTSAVLSVSNPKDVPKDVKDSDSGIGNSSSDASDVLVFGIDMEMPDLCKNLDLDGSSESSDTDEDATSVTSWEDMSTLDPNMLLFKAAQARNLPVMLEALANGADSNWVCTQDENKTPIMKAIETGSLAACEFLLLNGAKLDRVDSKGRSPLHLATLLGNTGQVCQFLKRGADIKLQDSEGQDPLSIAVSAANADIVTLLRLAKLNEEMKESDDYLGENLGDETFKDVFRDFTNMASNNPEKLKRNK